MSAAAESLAPSPRAVRIRLREATLASDRSTVHAARSVAGSPSAPAASAAAVTSAETAETGEPAARRPGAGDHGEPASTGPTVPLIVRLVPLTEPPARIPRSTTPAHSVPPVLGSVEARSRTRPAVGHGYRIGEPGPVGGPMPDPTPLCCAMVQAAVEGLRGVRPLAQLTRWVSPEVYDRLLLRAELVQRAGTAQAARAGIRRIRVFRIGDDVAEATVVVDDGPRVRAVAVRLETHRGRWRAVAMEIG